MAESNPTLCACGCGRPAPIAVQTNNARGVKQGQPQTFILGHHRSRTVKSYRMTAHGGTNALLHRVRAEKALGHPLPPDAIVHHPDCDPWNRHARLVILQDNAHHRLIHARMRVKAAGGNPNTDKICTGCKQVKPLTEFYHGENGWMDSHCAPCRRAISIQSYAKRKAERKAQQEVVIDTNEPDSHT